MRIQDVPQRGKKGQTVASRNRFGQYVKQLVKPKQPGTASQQAVWGNTRELWQVWNEISDQRRQAWWRLAERIRTRPILGESGPLDGPLVFRKINTVLRTCGRELLLDPPPLPSFGPNPILRFVVRPGQGWPSLRLQMLPDVVWEDRPAQEDLMLFAWAPCNPGVSRNSRYSFLGLLSAPVKGEIDIGELYLQKLKEWRKLKPARYHLPFEGSRIFIRVWQQVNGWENELGMFRANALIPARRWPR
jgi:hypothetical protein